MFFFGEKKVHTGFQAESVSTTSVLQTVVTHDSGGTRRPGLRPLPVPLGSLDREGGVLGWRVSPPTLFSE